MQKLLESSCGKDAAVGKRLRHFVLSVLASCCVYLFRIVVGNLVIVLKTEELHNLLLEKIFAQQSGGLR